MELLKQAKDQGLTGILHGALPDSGDSYVLTTTQETMTDYFASSLDREPIP